MVVVIQTHFTHDGDNSHPGVVHIRLGIHTWGIDSNGHSSVLVSVLVSADRIDTLVHSFVSIRHTSENILDRSSYPTSFFLLRTIFNNYGFQSRFISCSFYYSSLNSKRVKTIQESIYVYSMGSLLYSTWHWEEREQILQVLQRGLGGPSIQYYQQSKYAYAYQTKASNWYQA